MMSISLHNAESNYVTNIYLIECSLLEIIHYSALKLVINKHFIYCQMRSRERTHFC